MVYVKWGFWGLFWLILGAFFHYTLPQHDVVRITDTYEKRVDPGSNSLFWSNADTGSDPTTPSRDVFFIQTFQTNDRPMIYRNEDTGWGWPPYFKFDTSNLQAEASDLLSKKSEATAQWVVVTHYGWRNEFFSIFPNAVSIKPADGPDQSVIPWFNIVFLTVFAAFAWGIWVRWKRFRANRIDPMIEDWSGSRG